MFELDDTQRAFESAVRAWCEAELAPRVPAMERGEELPYDLLRRFARELGISETLADLAARRIEKLRSGDQGAGESTAGTPGLGGDPMLTSVLLKEVSRVSPGFAMAFLASLGCAMAIFSRGTADAIERWVNPLFRFDAIGSWALTEPGAGSDAFGGMRTTATLDGDEVVLNGHKTFISNAPYADVFAIFARVDPGPECGALVRPVVVERGTPGLETGPAMKKMGMHDSPTGEIFLDQCRVPRDAVIGSLTQPKGPRGGEALATLNQERTAMPAMCLGIIERCVEGAAEHAGARQQFGRPIGDFQGVSFKLARMEMRLENARNLVFKLAWAQRRGRLDARLASVAKLYCAEAAVQTALDAIQIHGGSGYMADLPYEKLMRDAKMFEIGGGTNEMQLQTIGRAVLSRTR